MKNKDKYTLTDLSVDASYLTDGCGKKIDGMRYLTIKHNGKTLMSELVQGKASERLMKWLEEEEADDEEQTQLF